jgi:hypothetical protein
MSNTNRDICVNSTCVACTCNYFALRCIASKVCKALSGKHEMDTPELSTGVIKEKNVNEHATCHEFRPLICSSGVL